MAQNISIWGASYSDVPAVTLPKTGGGTASFTDVSDTTATASDVASGKYFYTAAGVKTQGSATVPSGTINITQNGTTNVTQYAYANVTVPSVTYYTGTSAPSSSLGQDDDIYLQAGS